MKIYLKLKSFHSRKCNWKCRLPQWRPSCPGLNVLKHYTQSGSSLEGLSWDLIMWVGNHQGPFSIHGWVTSQPMREDITYVTFPLSICLRLCSAIHRKQDQLSVKDLSPHLWLLCTFALCLVVIWYLIVDAILTSASLLEIFGPNCVDMLRISAAFSA